MSLKSDEDSLFTASQLTEYFSHGQKLLFKPTEEVVLTYSPETFYKIKSKLGRPLEKAFGLKFILGQHRSLVLGLGLGAPAAVMSLEILLSLGVKACVQVGTAAGLGDEFKGGEILACEEAFRGEGTSKYYLKGGQEFVDSTREYLDKICRELLVYQIKINRVRSFTTDAPFRESPALINSCLNRNIGAIDMEASATYAFAKQAGLEIASLFVVSDRLTLSSWTPFFREARVNQALQDLTSALVLGPAALRP